jgi:putative tributyrin esterase
MRSTNLKRVTRLLLGFLLLITIHAAVGQTHALSKFSSSRITDCTFYSTALGRDMHYIIVLPQKYEDSQQRFPVLYLLHGWAGDYTNWVKLTKLTEYAERYSMIVVTPDAQNSWYVNSFTAPGDRFEDYIVNDLIHEIDSRWRTMPSPGSRSIAGLSMGGYGSVLLALKHPGLFAVVASVSGALIGPIGIEQVIPDVRESTDRAYGPAGSATRKDDDIYLLLAKAKRENIPYMFIECGSEDSLLASNRKFVEQLSSGNVAYEYHEYPGGHTWEFWDHSLPMMLRVIAERISADQEKAR